MACKAENTSRAALHGKSLPAPLSAPSLLRPWAAAASVSPGKGKWKETREPGDTLGGRARPHKRGDGRAERVGRPLARDARRSPVGLGKKNPSRALLGTQKRQAQRATLLPGGLRRPPPGGLLQDGASRLRKPGLAAQAQIGARPARERGGAGWGGGRSHSYDCTSSSSPPAKKTHGGARQKYLELSSQSFFKTHPFKV